MYIRTSISRTVTVSVYRTVNESIQQHSGELQQLVTINYDEPSSLTNCHPFLFFNCPTSFYKPSAVCVLWLFCVHLVESVEDV